MPGEDAESYQRFGVRNPRDFQHLVGDNFGQMIVIRDANNNHQINPPSHRIYFSNALQIRQRFGGLIYRAFLALDQNNR